MVAVLSQKPAWSPLRNSIANAVFHATGKRVRDLPITLEKLI